MSVTLSKYDSNSDLYEQYFISGENVSYDRRFLNGQSAKPLRRWTHTLDELGWRSSYRYIEHLKSLNFKEVKPYENRRYREKCEVS